MSVQISVTERRLQEIVAKKLQIEPTEVPLDAPLMDDSILDSMDKMMVILEIEEQFAPVDLSARDATDLRTIRELAAFLDRHAPALS